uniref:HAD family hydrolase n=1 Tax=Alistipes sp. TaxID=1872444 RepID=UPI004057B67D
MIFDLDGTLLNTLGDLAACCNEVLAEHGYSTHPLESYPSFIGNGIRRLVERAMPEECRTEEQVELLRGEFMARYTAKIDRYTTPYSGILELLGQLLQRGVKVAVASNKFQAGVDRLIERFFGDISFVGAFGHSSTMALKPSPEMDLAALAAAHVGSDEALHVGDSSVDIATARAAGVRSVAVTWGFSKKERLLEADDLIDRPEELLELL